MIMLEESAVLMQPTEFTAQAWNEREAADLGQIRCFMYYYEEEQEYWRQVFGEKEFIVEPENDIPF